LATSRCSRSSWACCRFISCSTSRTQPPRQRLLMGIVLGSCRAALPSLLAWVLPSALQESTHEVVSHRFHTGHELPTSNRAGRTSQHVSISSLEVDTSLCKFHAYARNPPIHKTFPNYRESCVHTHSCISTTPAALG
jgi:hypothetical protein